MEPTSTKENCLKAQATDIVRHPKSSTRPWTKQFESTIGVQFFKKTCTDHRVTHLFVLDTETRFLNALNFNLRTRSFVEHCTSSSSTSGHILRHHRLLHLCALITGPKHLATQTLGKKKRTFASVDILLKSWVLDALRNRLSNLDFMEKRPSTPRFSPDGCSMSSHSVQTFRCLPVRRKRSKQHAK